jgi:gamma-glutamyltranspeptidase/glutathione hydrolase
MRRAVARPRLAALILLLGGCGAGVAVLGGCAHVGLDSGPAAAPGAVASVHPLATRAGLEILEAGGSAADAAVATALALAVVYPQAGNLGGGGFALWVPAGEPTAARALDFRETAPRALAASDFLGPDGNVDRDKAIASVLAVGVPGSPAGLLELHRAHGRLPFSEVAAPAVRLAREGFDVDPFLARDLASPVLRSRLEASPGARAVFYPVGRPLAEGRRLRQPALARTIERLVAEGFDGFYRGPVAAALVAESERGGGRLTIEDFAGYAPVWRAPLFGRFGERTLVTMPPPSSGGVLLLQAFAILEVEGFDYVDEEPDARELHWWIEALRAGFADRAEHMGDPDFHPVPVAELLDPRWIATRRRAIGDRARPDIAPFVVPRAESGGETTHLSVLDGDGNAVSLTTTLNTTFGTGILVADVGVLLNNEMDDFAIQAGAPNAYGLVGSGANAVEPGKRPLSSMTPTVVCDGEGRVELVVGSPGGPRIITSVFQVLARVLAHGQPLEDAIRAPRLHQQWNPQHTFVERDFPAEVVLELERRGHVVVREGTWSDVQAIAVLPDGSVTAFSDPRNGGVAGTTDEGLLHAPARPR